MGCIHGKPSAIENIRESPREKQLKNKESSDLRVPRAVSSRRGESFRLKERLGSGDLRVGLIDKKGNNNNSRRVRDDNFVKKKDFSEVVPANYPGMGGVPNSSEGEQVAAGWPSWLVKAAGEAINGWIPRQADTFSKLDKIGQGTYSSVYKARDLIHNKVVALKRVRFDNMDLESVKFMAREILILRRLNHPNIIKLEGLITSQTSSSLYLVFEYMEHDLTGLASLPDVKFTEPQIKCYMQQLLNGLDHCHSHGVLHRDIKGSNLLLDNHGILKIADFGLASFYDYQERVPLTSRVVTLWYRPPELLLGATHYGVAVDLWSAGCILGELYAGKPIMPGRTEVEQLHKIFKLCGSPSEDYWRKSKLPHSTVFKPLQPYRRRLAETFQDYPPAALGLMDALLSIEPACRGTAASALKSVYFTTEPLACNPSSLPKYPPSKEIDAKMRDEEARRRQGAVRVKGQRVVREMQSSKEPQAVLDPEANGELVRSMQRTQGNSKPGSQNGLFNSNKEEAASDFPVARPRLSQVVKEASKDGMQYPTRIVSHSGPLVSGGGLRKAGKKPEEGSFVVSRGDLSTLSGLVASRTLVYEDNHGELHPSRRQETSEQMSRVSESFGEPTRSRHQNHHMQYNEHGRSFSKEPVSNNGHGFQGNVIHFSGPLLAASNNMDQLLKEHDLQIQDAARRARAEKKRFSKLKAHGMQLTGSSVYKSSHGVR